MRLRVTPSGPLRGTIAVAADKSVSHRAVMLASLADGKSRVKNLLEGGDVLATVNAFKQMGVGIDRIGDGDYLIHGVGMHGLKKPPAPLDLGNAGTALRLLTGILCAQPWASVVTGDASLRSRPMKRIIEPLTKMGAVIDADADRPPLTIKPSPSLRGVSYTPPVPSAQVKSCLLLAGLYADGVTAVSEATPTRDHTERMLAAFGGGVAVADGTVSVTGGDLTAADITVPGDLSSAAFFIVAASIVAGSDLTITGVGVNPTRAGVLAVLKKMRADIQLINRAGDGGDGANGNGADGDGDHGDRAADTGEPTADLRVRAADLCGVTVAGADTANAIDEIPALAVAAAAADGVTEIRDAADLRVKESDRINAVAAGLRALGVGVSEHDDGLTIVGGGGDGGGGGFTGGTVDSCGDHRIAMAFAVAGAAASSPVTVTDADNIATSFPDFCEVVAAAGVQIDVC